MTLTWSSGDSPVEPDALTTLARACRDRDDWRSLRLDRMEDVRAQGSTFVPRDAPDAAEYVGRSISVSPYRYVARVRFFAPESVVARHFSPSSATIEMDGPDACIVTAGADEPERMVFYFATVGADFEVLEPPEVADAVRSPAERLRRAASRP